MVPAPQALDRSQLALAARVQPGQAVGRLLARDRVEVELDALEVLEREPLALAEQLLDTRGPVAVQVLAGDVVRVVVRRRCGCWRSRSRRPAGSRARAGRHRARSPPTRTRRSSPASAGPGSCRGGSGASRRACSRCCRSRRPRPCSSPGSSSPRKASTSSSPLVKRPASTPALFTTGSRIAVQASASGSPARAPRASLTIGPWWV